MAVFVTQHNSSLSICVTYFRILSQEVAEKSLTEKKHYKQTNIVTEKAKLYTPYTGGINISKGI